MQVSTRITSPVRIRHLMVLVVYVALALAAVRTAKRALGMGHPDVVILMILALPIALGGVSAPVWRPGPHRDWVAASCYAAYFPLPIVVVAANFFPTFQRSGPSAKLFLAGLHLLLGCLLAFGVLAHVLRFMPVRRCPRCGRRGLVNSLREAVRGDHPPRDGYFRCGACDTEHVLTALSYSTGCPDCGRRTLMLRPYVFAWCLRCHTRCKRLWRRPWEDATDPQDDRFYWLWDLFGWITHVGSAVRTFRG